MRELGSNVNLLFLLGTNIVRTTDEDMDMYKNEYDVSVIGLSKDFIVVPATDKHILITNQWLIDRVSARKQRDLRVGLTSAYKQVHSHNMSVVAYAFRNEPEFLVWDYGQASDIPVASWKCLWWRLANLSSGPLRRVPELLGSRSGRILHGLPCLRQEVPHGQGDGVPVATATADGINWSNNNY